MYDQRTWIPAEPFASPAPLLVRKDVQIQKATSDDGSLWTEHGFALSPRATAFALAAAVGLSWLASLVGNAG